MNPPRRGPAPELDPGRPYSLDPDVTLRREPFGALAYHYGSRRLTFLRSELLADLVDALGSHESLDDVLEKLVSPDQRDRYLGALDSLAKSGFIRQVENVVTAQAMADDGSRRSSSAG